MTQALTKTDELKRSVSLMKSQFKAALPKHIPTERFIRTIQTAIGTNPDLVQSSRQSFFAACTKAAQDGLLPDGREAAIVTFNSKSGKQASYMPMVAGILKKVRNSGELASLTAQVVYEKDEFKFWVDEQGEHITHTPLMFGERGGPIGCYALAKTKDNGIYIEVMTEEQINAVKNVSRGKNGPWSGDFFLEMWKKTVIKRLSKRLPMSTDLEFTMKADEELYDLEGAETEETQEDTPIRDVSKPSRLNDLMGDDGDEDDKEVIEAKAEQVQEPVSEEEVPI